MRITVAIVVDAHVYGSALSYNYIDINIQHSNGSIRGQSVAIAGTNEQAIAVCESTFVYYCITSQQL